MCIIVSHYFHPDRKRVNLGGTFLDTISSYSSAEKRMLVLKSNVLFSFAKMRGMTYDIYLINLPFCY